ncbi:unnamed protein product, partial [marine sediment metagenome]
NEVNVLAMTMWNKIASPAPSSFAQGAGCGVAMTAEKREVYQLTS